MRSNARSRQRGFTLLELLVALTVFGLLMVGLSQGLRTGFALWRGQTQRLSEDSELDSSARVLRQLLTDIPTILRNGVVLPGMGPAAIGMNGTADSLAFVGDLPTGLGTIRRADMRIELRGDRLLLRWTPHRHEVAVEPRPPPQETELLRGVARLDIAYWGRPSIGQPAIWLDSWHGPALPQLIRLRLQFPSGDPRRWPDLIVAPQLWGPEM